MIEEKRESMDVETFIEHLDYCHDAIDPEEAFRMLRHEVEGEPPDPDHACRLERSDIPAFRQGLNDYADSMERSHEWVTFNNGSSYYTSAAVKDVLEDYPTWLFEYSGQLRKILSWWL
jgi:hypothetical protein